MNDYTLNHQLEALAEVIRDDLDRAERLGRGTVNLHAPRYYIQRLEEMLASSKSGGGQ